MGGKASKENDALVTQEYLKSILEYNPETGDFVWLNVNKVARNIHNGDIAGTLNNGYVQIQINRIRYFAHRLAWLYMTGNWPLYEIDHINHIRNNNRFVNLRDTYNNNWNQTKISKSNTSGYRGVCFHKASGKWEAQIQVNGIKKHLGHFDTPEEASVVYEEAKLFYHPI